MARRLSLRTVATAATLAIVATICLWPQDASACPVCFDPREESRLAFLLTTIFLTLLPLSLIGGTLYWLSRRMKERSELEALHDGAVAAQVSTEAT